MDYKEKILACPFCGTTPEVIYIGNDRSKKRSIKIKCPMCRITRTDATLRHDFKWLYKVAVKQWNKRTPSEKEIAKGAVEKYKEWHHKKYNHVDPGLWGLEKWLDKEAKSETPND